MGIGGTGNPHSKAAGTSMAISCEDKAWAICLSVVQLFVCFLTVPLFLPSFYAQSLARQVEPVEDPGLSAVSLIAV